MRRYLVSVAALFAASLCFAAGITHYRTFKIASFDVSTAIENTGPHAILLAGFNARWANATTGTVFFDLVNGTETNEGPSFAFTNVTHVYISATDFNGFWIGRGEFVLVREDAVELMTNVNVHTLIRN